MSGSTISGGSQLVSAIQQQTHQWLQSFVVKYNICPFAKREVERGSIRYKIVDSDDIEAQLATLLEECQILDTQPEIETTLFIIPQLSDFYDYLDFVDWSEGLLGEQGYNGVYQVASFHPDYCFANASKDDPSNYTNRSPYPMLHLIREQTITRLSRLHPDPEGIPETNIKLTQQLGLEALKQILYNCK
ncbi:MULTISPECIES: DUF1415 domain-containing protein [unclassified Agarivorans]|uniref:DUF1415 domain-containing protein n=1 Tax=unclassified Agarivorans TaxID=2636026 RepID=UPI003D7C56DE